MINFSSNNIQTTRRSGYVQTKELPQLGADDNTQKNVDNNKTVTEPVASVYDKDVKSPGLNYFVSNVNDKQKKERKNEKSTIQPDGTTKLKVGYLNYLHGQYLK